MYQFQSSRNIRKHHFHHKTMQRGITIISLDIHYFFLHNYVAAPITLVQQTPERL